jgi:Zn-dependent metalloprotease
MRKDHASELAAQHLSTMLPYLSSQPRRSYPRSSASDAERLQEKVKQLQDWMEQLQSSRDAGLVAQVNALQSRLDEAKEAKVSAFNDLKAAEITGDSLKQSHAALQKELVNVKEQLEEVQLEATKERDAAVALVNARLVEAQNQATATEGTLLHLQKVQQVMFETSEASKKRSGELEVANAGIRREYEGLQEEHAMLEEVQRPRRRSKSATRQ